MLVSATRCRAILVLLLAMLAGAASTAAQAQQSSELAELTAQVGALYRAGRYPEALPIAHRALALAERQLGPTHPTICTSLDYLALLYKAQGQYADAEPLLKRSIGISEKAYGPDSTNLAISLINLAGVYREQGRHSEAEPLFKRALAVHEKVLGPHHPHVATALNNLAELYRAQVRYSDAEPLFKRALAIREKALGADHINVGVTLDNLGLLYVAQGRYGEAEPLHKRAVAIFEKGQGPDGPSLGAALENLALLYQAQGRYGEAEPLLQRALRISEKALGPHHPDVGTSLNNLALLYHAQGRFGEAAQSLKRSLEISENALGPDHPTVGDTLNNLSGIYQTLGRYGEAELTLKRALAIRERMHGPNHPLVGGSLGNLASLYQDQSRYGEAESLLKRALDIRERTLGPNHVDVATSLEGLGVLYQAQGRFAEALLLLQRALDTREKALGRDHPSVGDTLHNLALVLPALGRYGPAEDVMKQSLRIAEKTLGPDHPAVGDTLNLLASLYKTQGRNGEAESLAKRSLGIAEKALGTDHPSTGIALSTLAEIYDAQGRDDEAEVAFKRALAIREAVLGPDHPTVGNALSNLALLSVRRHQWRVAADYWRRSTDVIIRRATTGSTAADHAFGARTKSEAVRHNWKFFGLVKMAHRVALEEPAAQAGLASEMFRIAQWAQASEAAAALHQMAARGAAGNPGLAAQVRERQDLVTERQKRDLARIDAVSQRFDRRDRAAEATNLARLSAVDARIAAIDQRLAAEHPDYVALVRPQPLGVADVRAELAADEALVVFLDTPEMGPAADESFVWAVTRTDVRWVRSDLGTRALKREVAALRCGLDAVAWHDEGEAACQSLLGSAFARADYEAGSPLPFEPARAHKLYVALFGEVGDLIKGRHMLLVPSGPLATLPFQVLVTEPPAVAGADLQGPISRSIAWLGRTNALTVLPAVSSLKALRRVGRPSAAAKTMIGFGNPLLDGDPTHPKYGAEDAQRAALARTYTGCARTVARRSASRRGLARSPAPPMDQAGHVDVAEILRLSPLPETADELCAVARDLAADVTEIRLGSRATEREIKTLSAAGALARYRILHFATHGVLAGQIDASTEPGLILTPPAKATGEDDGYLSASEIADLKLDADWVILSACNTAGGAGGERGAEALGGLARAFFYAQARALLVSHWEVDSDATVKLITAAVGTIAKDKSVGRAEALRRAMLALIDTGQPHEAHPAYWAPFVVVGEGAARN